MDGAGATATTSTMLDVNLVARQQLHANMPGIVARALVRRAVKGAAGAAVEKGVGASQGKELGALLGIFTTALATAPERAETRNWTSLPAQIQVARVPVSAGPHVLSFGGSMTANVNVAAGHDSYVVIVRPNLTVPGAVLVDKASFVAPAPPAPVAPSPAAQPIPIPTKK